MKPGDLVTTSNLITQLWHRPEPNSNFDDYKSVCIRHGAQALVLAVVGAGPKCRLLVLVDGLVGWKMSRLFEALR